MRKKSNVPTVKAVKPIRTIARKPWPFPQVDNPIGLAIQHVDGILEKISKGKIKKFDEVILSQLRKLTAPEIKHLFKSYKTTLTSMKSALAGDAFFIESYSNFTEPRLKIAVQCLSSLKKLQPDAKSSGKKIRVQTKERKIKEKTPEDKVKTALYCIHDPETDVRSKKPNEALGAAELWVYNIKTRKLGCYYALDKNGISIQGTTIINYNVEKSTTKNIRHPKNQIPEFMQGRIQWMRGCNRGPS